MTTPLIGSTTIFYDVVQVLNSLPPPTLDLSRHILQQNPTLQLSFECSYELPQSMKERFAKLPNAILKPISMPCENRLNQEPLESLFEDYEINDPLPIPSAEISSTESYW